MPKKRDQGKRKRVLVCGSGNWTNRDRIREILNALTPMTLVIHGDTGLNAAGEAVWRQPDEFAVRGADKLAGAVARDLGFRVRVYSPDWQRDLHRALQVRNQRLIDEGEPGVGFVFCDDLEAEPILLDLVQRAEAAGVFMNRITAKCRPKVLYYGFLAPDDPRWRDDWSITVGPGATRGSKPPFTRQGEGDAPSSATANPAAKLEPGGLD